MDGQLIQPEVFNQGQCPFDSEKEQVVFSGRELEPLSPGTDRREVQRRLVGPLIAITTLNAIDGLRENGNMGDYHQAFAAGFEEINRADVLSYDHINRGLDPAYKVLTDDLEKEIQAMPEMSECSYDKSRSYTIQLQQDLFRQNTFHGRLMRIMHEGLQTQGRITNNIVLPGYLACKDKLPDGRAIAEKVKDLGRKV